MRKKCICYVAKLRELYQEDAHRVLENFKKKTKNMRKNKVFNHIMESGDFIKVSLVSPPVNGVDDILLEIKSKNIDGIQGLVVQDWEAILICKAFTRALEKKYGTIERCIKQLIKQKKLVKTGE